MEIKANLLLKAIKYLCRFKSASEFYGSIFFATFSEKVRIIKYSFETTPF